VFAFERFRPGNVGNASVPGSISAGIQAPGPERGDDRKIKCAFGLGALTGKLEGIEGFFRLTEGLRPDARKKTQGFSPENPPFGTCPAHVMVSQTIESSNVDAKQAD